MPLYTYKCNSCGHEFDDLVKYDKRDEAIPCKMCGKSSSRVYATSFGIKSGLDPKKDTIYSSKEIDRVVGEKAEERWQGYDKRWKTRYEERRKKRWKGRTPQVLNIPKESDGTFSPVKHLGSKKDKTIRTEFSEALQEHRAQRKAKNLDQFDGPGAIEE